MVFLDSMGLGQIFANTIVSIAALSITKLAAWNCTSKETHLPKFKLTPRFCALDPVAFRFVSLAICSGDSRD